MFLATASTKRPIAMASLLIALVFLGLNSYRKLSLENLPAIDVPYVTITTIWAGASAEDVEKDIAKRVEDAISGVEGLKHTSSTCTENVVNTILEFNMGINVDIAAQDVREKLDPILSELPDDADEPIIQKFDINASAIASFFLMGDMPINDLYWYADNQLSDRFASVEGVAEVQIIGGNEREVWVELDRDKLASAGLTAANVVEALQKEVLSVPSGRLRQMGSEYSIKFDAEYKTIEQIEGLQVGMGSDGERRYISDLGKVHLGAEEVRERAFLNHQPGIAIKIVKKSDGNTVETIENVRKRFEEMKSELPAGVELRWLQDDAAIVQANVNNTLNDVFSSVILCAVILFLFLLNLRTTFIVAVTMPITIIISIFFINLAGLTLNMVTLLAIGLSAGILVSNSIVVLENITKRFNDIPDRWEAARVGTSEVAVAVLASAGTNVVVMIPIAMMTSIVGKYFTPFAVTTLIVNAASIFISFTLTPMLCALWMRSEKERTTWLARKGLAWEKTLGSWGLRYATFLRKLSDNRLTSAALLLLTLGIFFVIMYFGSGNLGFVMMEDDDWGRIQIRLEYPDYYDLEKTTAATLELSTMLENYLDVRSVMLTVGKSDAISGQASEGVYLANFELVYPPAAEREYSILDVEAELQRRLNEIPDLIATVTIPGFSSSGPTSTIEYVLKGPDLTELTNRAQEFQREAYKLPELAVLDTSARDDKPEILIHPNRAVMADIGLNAAGVGTILRANVDGIEAAEFKEDVKTIDVRVKLEERPGYDQVAAFPIPTLPGRPIPLEAFTTQELTGQKVLIFRHDKERAISIQGSEKQGFASSTVMNKIEKAVTEKGIVDENYVIDKTGVAELLDETVADFSEAILLATLLTFLTLSAILESFSRPFVVLTTFPISLAGVLLALAITKLNLSIFVLMGVVMLIGVVVNAAILIVDRMDQLHRAGQPLHDALYNGFADTFRAVIMVIIASGLGMIPCAMSTGIGAVCRVGIGAASVGGILVAGLFTVTTFPLLYAFFTKNKPRT